MVTPISAESLKIVERVLHVPQLSEIKSVIGPALAKNFGEYTVEVVDCPDLTQAPFGLAASGLGGKPTILEVGGPSYLLPLVDRSHLYDLRTILSKLNYGEKAFVVGAGAGPWPHLSRNCEMMMNLMISPSGIKNETRLAWVNKEEKCVLEKNIGDETRFALLANLFATEGKSGKVLRVHAKRRTGDLDFIATMQKALEAHYTDKLVGLGGTFLLKEGKAKQHVMQDFSKTPVKNVTDLNNWLRFYDMSAPLINVGTFVSSVTDDLDLRVQHFHSYGHQNEGGHYHNDTTPETVEYLGYFNVADTLQRIDQDSKKLNFGKD